MDIIYFSGFQLENRFSGSFDKIETLKKLECLSYTDRVLPIEINYYNNLEESIKLVKHSLSYESVGKYYKQRNTKFMFIGTSLGAFFAYYFSKVYSAPALLLNPCYAPGKQLYRYLGKSVGTPNFGFSAFSERSLRAFKSFEEELKFIHHDYPNYITTVVNKDDENTEFSEKGIQELRSVIPDGKLITYETGGHQVKNFSLILEEVFIPLFENYKKFDIDLYSSIAM